MAKSFYIKGIARKIKFLRILNDLEQLSFGHVIGVSRVWVSLVENGLHPVKKGPKHRIEKQFGLISGSMDDDVEWEVTIMMSKKSPESL